MSKREKSIYKKAYITAVRDITAFIGIVGIYTAMIVISLIR